MHQRLEGSEGVAFLRNSGSLFEFNTHIVNPIGACAYFCEDGKLIVLTEPGNPALFTLTPEKYLEGRKKRDAYMKQVGNTNLKIRQGKLGYIVQGPNDHGGT